MVPLINKELRLYTSHKICHICKTNMLMIKKIVQLEIIITKVYRGAGYSICNLKYSKPKETPVVFHNEPNCNYHFIIQKLVEEFKGQFSCFGENTEKYITFSVPVKKDL